MLWHGLDSECEKAAAPINWYLRIKNHGGAGKEYNYTSPEKVNPRLAVQIQKEHEKLQNGKGNQSNEQEAPMLQKCLQTISSTSMLHKLSWPNLLLYDHWLYIQTGF